MFADVMCDQIRILDLECIHDAGNVDRLVLLGVAGIRVVGHTHAAQGRGRSRYGPWPE